jgi:dTDP-4-amino-4,6-dideoxygalactose transaminase
MSVDDQIQGLDLKAQYATIRHDVLAAVERVLESQKFILGAEGQALEGGIANFLGCRHAIGLASGTDALILALRTCGIGPGDEVLCPSFSFIATADAVSLLGGIPVFVDIDPNTFTINPAGLERRRTPRCKAIVPVHLYGQAADLDPILEFARHCNLHVIEDSAQAIGATYKGKKTGTLGDIGCLSFFPSKNLGACGDGGIAVCNDEAYSRQLQLLRSHGCTKKYFSEQQGWNSRLDEIQAAILRVKLRYLEEWSAARRRKASEYDRLLKQIPGVQVPVVAPWGEHVFHQYTIRVRNRDQIQGFLMDRGISTTVYYPTPIHLQPIYRDLGYKQGDFPETERASLEVLSLPIYPELKPAQMERVAAALADAVMRFG